MVKFVDVFAEGGGSGGVKIIDCSYFAAYLSGLDDLMPIFQFCNKVY